MTKETRTFAIKVGHENVVYTLDESDHALFLSLGSALATIQSFESSAASLLTGLLGQTEESSQKTHEQLMGNYIDKTLGQLVKLFRQYVKDEALADKLEQVRQKRNYLVHGILRKYGWWLMGDDAYLDAIKEISEISQLIQETDQDIVKYIIDRKLLKMVAAKIDTATGELVLIGASND
jgi:hypothetical protein